MLRNNMISKKNSIIYIHKFEYIVLLYIVPKMIITFGVIR